MQLYLDCLSHIFENGTLKGDRTGTGTQSIFGHQMRFNLQDGFPLLTTKKVYFKGVAVELLWFLMGDTNIDYLVKNKVKIWDAWADDKGDLGPVYGKQWRRWAGVNGKTTDQISDVVHQIRTNPNSRRLIVNAWNVGELDQMALAPCHFAFQFYVAAGRLSCQVFQRSADIFLGVPFNIASYALLTHMIAQQTDLEVGDLVWTGGDVHLYHNHVNQAKEQLLRKPSLLPKLAISRRPASIFDYTFDDFKLIDYNPAPAIKASVSV